MNRIAKFAVVPFFYFVISVNGHYAGTLSFKEAKSCIANAYAMSQQLSQDQISYCYDSQTGKPIVTDVFNQADGTNNADK